MGLSVYVWDQSGMSDNRFWFVPLIFQSKLYIITFHYLHFIIYYYQGQITLHWVIKLIQLYNTPPTWETTSLLQIKTQF